MDPSSSSFYNYDIEAAKRSIKCDSWLFLVLYFIPNLLTIFTGIHKYSIELIFWISIIYSPYWLAAVLGFLASSKEMCYLNCYSGMLKCTLIYIITGTTIVVLIFIFLLFAVSRDQSGGRMAADISIVVLLFFLAFLCLVYSVSAIILWCFANKHANSLKDLISRKVQYFQNPNMTGGLSTNGQFFPASGIEIGKYPQHYAQYYPDNIVIA
ncbi:unnamed protein product [Blepharisma stoltei]|uniref:Uncharacterized protein n=1 Tax=Blepharisma stoltei TaxID=1481888 RepID=A0AAU9J7F1_9CILI|nr:unnamed protein product [Blepharisma stoltei]